MNPRVDLVCLKCGNATQLRNLQPSNYAWVCADKCLPPVDTGVPADEELADLQGRSPVEIIFSDKLSDVQIKTLKVYSPQILIHFIDCHTPGCYMQIYNKFLVPHFDNVAVLDYVLRTPIVSGEEILKNGIPEPKMFGELLMRLKDVKSTKIHDYLVKTFGLRLV
jgi:hypothetical protein